MNGGAEACFLFVASLPTVSQPQWSVINERAAGMLQLFNHRYKYTQEQIQPLCTVTHRWTTHVFRSSIECFLQVCV